MKTKILAAILLSVTALTVLAALSKNAIFAAKPKSAKHPSFWAKRLPFAAIAKKISTTWQADCPIISAKIQL